MKTVSSFFVSSLGLAALLVAGCSKDRTGGEPPVIGPQPGVIDGAPPDMARPKVEPAHYSGIYEADALLDFTQPGVLPGLDSPALAALSNLGTDPGTALVNFAQAAGAINIDSTLRTIIGAVITQQLDKVLPQDVLNDLQLISNITQITKNTTLQTSFTVHTPAFSGSTPITIVVTGATFDFIDSKLVPQHVVVMTSAANLATATTTLTASLVPHTDSPVADADLTFSGGSLDLPIGDYMLGALGPLVFEPEFGTPDLNSTLQLLLMKPCQDLGTAVEQGVENLTGIDIGSSVGTTICTTAVTLAAAEITTEIGKLQINGVKISDGHAVLSDVSPTHPTVDHQSDLMTGNWTWSFGGTDVPTPIINGNRTGTSL